MTDKNPYPPMAFPSVIGAEEVLYEGMTLRTYIATKALQGLLATERGDKHEVAAQCVDYADALMAALGVPND
jgi:hypothetical protein